MADTILTVTYTKPGDFGGIETKTLSYIVPSEINIDEAKSRIREACKSMIADQLGTFVSID